MVSYARIQMFVAFVDAVGIGVGAAIIGVPLALPLAVLVFIGSFIPVVGAPVTGAIAVLLALVANGPVNALIMLGIVLLVQQLESHILQPLVMGKAVALHPVAVILSVAAGSYLAGIPGALFSVPILAVANSAIRYIAGRTWEHELVPASRGWQRHCRLRRRRAGQHLQGRPVAGRPSRPWQRCRSYNGGSGQQCRSGLRCRIPQRRIVREYP